uniref:uracil phosphoribosyltransferase n=1 Tax=Fulvivirga sp. TaxID=1931237 RepID=UPI004048F224
MKTHILNSANSILNQYLLEIRDVNLQKDRMRFRYNLERIGGVMAYEISKTLEYQLTNAQTPLAGVNITVPQQFPYLIAVMRAALPFHQGFMQIFDKSDSGFVGAYREPKIGHEFEIDIDYLAIDNLDGKDVILLDPMLATGRSIVDVVRKLLVRGTPKSLHIASVISSEEGASYINKNLEVPYQHWTAAMDAELNDHYYIVPGLGDAGDLAYGQKK